MKNKEDKKMKIKKAVSIVLSLAISVQVLSVSAFAVDNKGELPEMAQVVIGQNDFGEVRETRTLYDAMMMRLQYV